MRSQLFGFVVQSKLFYELLLDCPQDQAISTMNKHLAEHDALLNPSHMMRPGQIHYLNEPHTIAFETYMNEWDEEIVELVQGVLAL
ncbi:MAG: hypothetical protein KC415_22570, partial [Anaerolineales bacterium]|nr:hypothetical protein [Anaerolineales bacterium]